MHHRYILFYKPYNVLSQFSSNKPEQQTLKDFLPIPRIYPVGRLDQDSEGLMLLTSHGKVQHRLSNPQFRHPRTYWAQVERIPDVGALQQLERGVSIKNYRTLPAKAKLIEEDLPLPPRNPPIRYRKSVPTAWIELTLTEGKNRQVRRMTAAVGHPTLRLVRVAIAHLHIGNLAPGEWRDLTAGERQKLLKL